MNYENMTRRRVLCFGDSNTYGYDPARDGRYGDDERYPMVLQDLLGDGWSVVEEGLPGRTAVFDDPITEGMNGLRVITPILMSHAPLDTVTIMLGTNDSKERFGCNSHLISRGIVRLVKKALHTECWRDNARPDVLVIVPPSITPEYDHLIFKDAMGTGCHERCAGIAALDQDELQRAGYPYRCRTADLAGRVVSCVDYSGGYHRRTCLRTENKERLI